MPPPLLFLPPPFHRQTAAAQEVNSRLRAQAAAAAAKVVAPSQPRGASNSASEQQDQEVAAAAVARLQMELRAEQATRRQAERDFLELMQSVEEGEGDSAGPAAELASQRLGVVQVCARSVTGTRRAHTHARVHTQL